MGYPGLPLRYSQLVIKPKLTYPKLTLTLGLPPWLPPWLPPGLPPTWSPWLVYPEYILKAISRFCPASASSASYYYLLLECGSARLGRVKNKSLPISNNKLWGGETAAIASFLDWDNSFLCIYLQDCLTPTTVWCLRLNGRKVFVNQNSNTYE